MAKDYQTVATDHHDNFISVVDLKTTAAAASAQMSKTSTEAPPSPR